MVYIYGASTRLLVYIVEYVFHQFHRAWPRAILSEIPTQQPPPYPPHPPTRDTTNPRTFRSWSLTLFRGCYLTRASFGVCPASSAPCSGAPVVAHLWLPTGCTIRGRRQRHSSTESLVCSPGQHSPGRLAGISATSARKNLTLHSRV